ncbi:Subtilase family protein [Anaerocolumna jejuensis DSM 15929]|uniref:Subtilase family protein n=1 Tax=Anaerocolumna jejuensis DSM 15929 TaxID=1121322 RepID=A0A1M6USS4_9FIRM|nr:S8 family peptidase [Anaerocolumna jejuensis]SHK72214.1 Subtilase family protein [Anaerocolumna jejuensis DSM 15929]
MTESERFKILSDDFADLIVSNQERDEIVNTYPDTSVSLTFDDSSVVHIPVENMTFDSIHRFGYNRIPACFGLLNANEDTFDYNIRNLPVSFKVGDGYSGKGVIIGFIDTGIDYRNQTFLKEDGTSRILTIWDQSIDSSNYPQGFFYGTEYNNGMINEALKAENPLAVVPSMDTIGHGTMMAGIAGGSKNTESGFSGVADDIIFAVVKLKPAKAYIKEFFSIPPDAVCFQENDIITGVVYLHQLALANNKPLIICLGIGTSQSDHTGNRTLSRFLASFSEINGRAVAVAAGNESNRGSHYYGDIKPPTAFDDVILTVGENTYGFTMQFWGTAPNWFWIDLYAPDGGFITRIPPTTSNSILYSLENMTIIADSQVKEPYSTEQFIVLRFNQPVPGNWHFYVYGIKGDLPMRFHFWLPIHNFLSAGTTFLEPNNNTTIVAPGNNSSLICATAYNPVNNTLFFYASKGNTVNNFPKPDITAPGVNILSPYLDNKFIQVSGTSVASAYIAGVLSLLLEWGVTNGNFPQMSNALMKKIITQSASRRPNETYPNPDWGYGIVDIANMGNVINSIISVQETMPTFPV